MHILTRMGFYGTLGWAVVQPVSLVAGVWQSWQLIFPLALLGCAVAGIFLNGSCRFGAHTWMVYLATEGTYDGWVRDALETCPPIKCQKCAKETTSRAELCGGAVLIYPSHWDRDYAARVAAYAAAEHRSSER